MMQIGHYSDIRSEGYGITSVLTLQKQ